MDILLVYELMCNSNLRVLSIQASLTHWASSFHIVVVSRLRHFSNKQIKECITSTWQHACVQQCSKIKKMHLAWNTLRVWIGGTTAQTLPTWFLFIFINNSRQRKSSPGEEENHTEGLFTPQTHLTTGEMHCGLGGWGLWGVLLCGLIERGSNFLVH